MNASDVYGTAARHGKIAFEHGTRSKIALEHGTRNKIALEHGTRSKIALEHALWGLPTPPWPLVP